jgi:hypothetical protein
MRVSFITAKKKQHSSPFLDIVSLQEVVVVRSTLRHRFVSAPFHIPIMTQEVRGQRHSYWRRDREGGDGIRAHVLAKCSWTSKGKSIGRKRATQEKLNDCMTAKQRRFSLLLSIWFCEVWSPQKRK